MPSVTRNAKGKMKREKRILPLSELEVTVEGLLPKASRCARLIYLVTMLLLLFLFAAIFE